MAPAYYLHPHVRIEATKKYTVASTYRGLALLDGKSTSLWPTFRA